MVNAGDGDLEMKVKKSKPDAYVITKLTIMRSNRLGRSDSLSRSQSFHKAKIVEWRVGLYRSDRCI